MKIKCAIIGAGEFTFNNIIPSLSRTNRFDIKYLVARSRQRILELGDALGSIKPTSSIDEVLHDPEINCVFVSTRHHLHKDQIIAALAAGKNVFSEKPLAMNLNDARQIVAAARHSTCKMMLGFNRRFSPFALEIRRHLQHIAGPFIVNYRWINKMWDVTWPFDAVEGGGKLISSGCHLLDLTMFLLNEVPRQISASISTMIRPQIKTHDSASLCLEFASGSVANICTSELGATSLPQEKMEIFTRQGAIVMEDFQKLSFYDMAAQNITLAQPEKGIDAEMIAFADYLEGKTTQSPCSVLDGYNTVLCCAAALESQQKQVKIQLDAIDFRK